MGRVWGNRAEAPVLHLAILTGMSGAGKTLAIQSLEDLGYFCVDNLPPALLADFVDLLQGAEGGGLLRAAVVVDLRGKAFFSVLLAVLEKLPAKRGLVYRLLYLDASDGVLVQRYKATRRSHPLAWGGSLLEGIQAERQLLAEVRKHAHCVIDTSGLQANDLKRTMASYFSQAGHMVFRVVFLSFGFKHGLPLDADLVFDVRFLPNPHYVEELRPRTGVDPEVRDYVLKAPLTEKFLGRLRDFLAFLLPWYEKEGKQQLSIAIGCTGGRHRSVAISDHLAQHFKDSFPCQALHRDVRKEG